RSRRRAVNDVPRVRASGTPPAPDDLRIERIAGPRSLRILMQNATDRVLQRRSRHGGNRRSVGFGLGDQLLKLVQRDELGLRTFHHLTPAVTLRFNLPPHLSQRIRLIARKALDQVYG